MMIDRALAAKFRGFCIERGTSASAVVAVWIEQAIKSGELPPTPKKERKNRKAEDAPAPKPKKRHTAHPKPAPAAKPGKRNTARPK